MLLYIYLATVWDVLIVVWLGVVTSSEGGLLAWWREGLEFTEKGLLQWRYDLQFYELNQCIVRDGKDC